jgi:hypothetical protein
VRWRQGNVLFATLNVSGSALPAGEQSAALERATLDWLDEAFSAGRRTSDARALVIAFHANPGFESHAGGKARKKRIATCSIGWWQARRPTGALSC